MRTAFYWVLCGMQFLLLATPSLVVGGDARKQTKPSCLEALWPALLGYSGPTLSSFSRWPQKIRQLFEQNDYQGTIWALRESGFEQEAAKLSKWYSEILKSKQVKKIDHFPKYDHVWLVDLGDGNRGVFKVDRSMHGYRHEVAAYILDQLLGLNLVPITVERTTVQGSGSLQPFFDERTVVPGVLWQEPVSKDAMVLFDVLIGNRDRHSQNYFVRRADAKVIGIDHALAFGANGPRGRYIDTEESRAILKYLSKNSDVLKSLKKLNFLRLKRALGSYLEDWRIRALLARRDEILDAYKEGAE